MGFLVQLVADAMTAQLPNDPVAVIFREFLDGRPDVTEVLARSHLGIPASRHSPATSRSLPTRGETAPTGYV
jgi:hypothetical protein